MTRAIVVALLLCPATVLAPQALAQSDVDGPDCGRVIQDFGDAPEGVESQYGGVGHYPTCLAAGPAGTLEAVCAARGTSPGPTGYMKHVLDGTGNYWLKGLCNPTSLSGVDSDLDGKFSSAGVGPSVCNPAVPADPAPPVTVAHGQDEYGGDDGDTGAPPDFLIACDQNVVYFGTANCGPDRIAYLNILVDLNSDGDWNDNIPCDEFSICPQCVGVPCVHEWAVKNHPFQIGAGCQTHSSPPFLVGAVAGPAWVRVSLTDQPVDDDFPWAGSANRPGGSYAGGETEDHVVYITTPDPVTPSTWGRMKIRYR